MGMHHYANNGIFVDITKYTKQIIPLLSPKTWIAVREWLQAGDPNIIVDERQLTDDQFIEFANWIYVDGNREIELLVNDHTYRAEIFFFTEEDEGEDVEEGVPFLFLFEDWLYTRKPTAFAASLKQDGIVWDEKRWVSWG